jgi:YbgC/YbaW family acyl-CoA thioester hydrolase
VTGSLHEAETGPVAGAGASPASIVVERRVEWSDTDASGVYHNTTVIRLVETAETLLLSELGMLDEIYGRLPRVRLELDFRRALRFHDLVEVHLGVVAVGRSSVTYAFDVRREGKVCVEGTAIAALVDGADGRPSPWPDGYRRLLLGAGPQATERLARDGGPRPS